MLLAGQGPPDEVPTHLHNHKVASCVLEDLKGDNVRSPSDLNQQLTRIGVCHPHIAADLWKWSLLILDRYERLYYSQAA